MNVEEWQPIFEGRLEKAVASIWDACNALSKIGATQRKEANIDMLMKDLKKIEFDLYKIKTEKYPWT